MEENRNEVKVQNEEIRGEMKLCIEELYVKLDRQFDEHRNKMMSRMEDTCNDMQKNRWRNGIQPFGNKAAGERRQKEV